MWGTFQINVLVFCLNENNPCGSTSPGSIHVEAVDVEGEQRNHVRQQWESKGEAQASGQASVPQNGLDEWRH